MTIHLIEFRAMGCGITVQLEAGKDGAAILSRIPEQVAELERTLTRFNPTSELMQLNARAGQWVTVSDVLLENIRTAKQAAFLTDGLYNPLVLPALIANGYDRSFEQLDRTEITPSAPLPDWRGIEIHQDAVRIPSGSALDLGGIAKGWTAAHLADELSQHGACLVNIGGDMAIRGAPDGLLGWGIDIEDPASGEVFLSLWLSNISIATSGIDFRHWQDVTGQVRHHIIDPQTGFPAQTDVLAVSVVHPHAPTAEAYAKAVMVRGAEDGLNWLNQQWQAVALVFKQDGTVLSTFPINERTM